MTRPPAISQTDFGKLPGGAPVHLYTLTNQNGLEARIMSYGGVLVSLKTPDRSGALADIVLGFDSLEDYLKHPSPYFGALIGRYANRIANAAFSLNGKTYHVPKNDGPNSLHGGSQGFDKRLWTSRITPDAALELTYTSIDGEQGYPGTLNVTVNYQLTDLNELKIDYTAVTNQDTVLNLTNHSYFNLSGAGQGDILSHLVTINAARFTPIDAVLIPTGELSPVDGTPFDFRHPTAIGAHIGQPDEQLKRAGGYDHNWVLDRTSEALEPVAHVYEPTTGRVMEVLTTEPGLQLYSGNFLDGSLTGKGGHVYGHRTGFCMETQHFPDSPNQPKFPNVILKPGHTWQSATVYRFSTQPL